MEILKIMFTHISTHQCEAELLGIIMHYLSVKASVALARKLMLKARTFLAWPCFSLSRALRSTRTHANRSKNAGLSYAWASWGCALLLPLPTGSLFELGWMESPPPVSTVIIPFPRVQQIPARGCLDFSTVWIWLPLQKQHTPRCKCACTGAEWLVVAAHVTATISHAYDLCWTPNGHLRLAILSRDIMPTYLESSPDQVVVEVWRVQRLDSLHGVRKQ